MKNKRGAFLLFSMVLIALTAVSGFSQSVITNGTGIYIGVRPEGNLGVFPGETPYDFPAPYNSFPLGLYYAGTGSDSTAPGCVCEGWGVGVDGGAHVGYSDVDAGGVFNLTVDSFTTNSAGSPGSTAVSLVHLTSLPGLSVRQSYGPSSSAALIRDLVTITNNTGATVSGVRYDRTMDWDIGPTTFNEYSTIQGWPATNLIYSDNNGFNVPNPYGFHSPYGMTNVNFVDAGPTDHGADFIFDFGSLLDGESRTFSIYYGAAPTEALALAALSTVGAQVYSFGQASSFADGSDNGPDHGEPNTFIFGFGSVGGHTVPEPASLFLVGAGLVGLLGLKRKKSA